MPRHKRQRLRIIPGDLGVRPRRGRAQLIAEESTEPGARRDFTAEVSWQVEPAGIVTIDAGGYVRPIAAGEATVRGGHESQGATAVVRVEAAAERAWDFGEDVVPILTRSGCNTGGCHGRADGQNGFHLSLFGYDPGGRLPGADARRRWAGGSTGSAPAAEPGPGQGDRPDSARRRAADPGRLGRVSDARWPGSRRAVPRRAGKTHGR